MKFRTGIADIAAVQDALAYTIKGSNSIPSVIFPIVRYSKDHNRGVKYASSQKEVQDQWKEDVTRSDGKSRVLIFEKKSQADRFKRDLPEELKKFGENVKYIFRDVKSNAYSDPGTVQGLEFDHVYVAIEDYNTMPSTGQPELIYKRRVFLTAQSRVQKFLMMPVPSNQVEKSSEANAGDIHEIKIDDIVSDTFNTSENEDAPTESTEELKKPTAKTAKKEVDTSISHKPIV